MLLQPYAWSEIKARDPNSRLPRALQIFGLASFGADATTYETYLRLYPPPIYQWRLKPEYTLEQVLELVPRYTRHAAARLMRSDLEPELLAGVFGDDPRLLLERVAMPGSVKEKSDHFLEAFWLLNNLRPYQPLEIEIEDLEILDARPASSELQFSVGWDRVRGKVPSPPGPEETFPTMFWDIEAYSASGNFTDPERPSDRIFSISALVKLGSSTDSGQQAYQGYVLTTLPFDPAQVKTHLVPLEVVACADEAALLESFFSLLTRYHPHLQVTYNGNFYDKNYLITRAELLGLEVPRLSKLWGLPSRPRYYEFASGLSTTKTALKDRSREYLVPDMEDLDLLLYCRRWLPGLPNYRLETVSQWLLGQGKTGLEVEQMFEAVRSEDPAQTQQIIDYSFVDSVLLSQLESKLKAWDRLTQVANLGRLPRTLLPRLTDAELIGRLLSSLDHGFWGRGFSLRPAGLLSPPRPGIYREVLRYDYSGLAAQVLANYQPGPDVVIYRQLAELLALLPCGLVNKIMCCSLLPEDITSGYAQALARLPAAGKVGLTQQAAWYLRPIEGLPTLEAAISLALVDEGETQYRLVRSPAGQLEIHHFGRKLEFPYKAAILEKYLQGLVSGTDFMWGRRLVSIYDLPVSQFILHKKVKPLEASAAAAAPWSLYSQLRRRGVEVTTWMRVRCLRVVVDSNQAKSRLLNRRSNLPIYHADNSRLFLLLKDEDIFDCPPLDVAYYIDSVNKMLERLDRLPWWSAPGSGNRPSTSS